MTEDGRPKREPSADIRKMGNACHEIFTGLVDAGFTEAQAERILGTMLSATILKGDGND